MNRRLVLLFCPGYPKGDQSEGEPAPKGAVDWDPLGSIGCVQSRIEQYGERFVAKVLAL